MIGTLAKTTFFAMLAVVIAWGWALRNPSRPGYVEIETRRAAEVVKSEKLLATLPAHATRGSHLLGGVIPDRISAEAGARLREGAGVSAIHLALVLSTLPAFILAMGGGVSYGLWRRERIRHGLTYASPSLGGFAKVLLMGGVVYLIVFSTSPLGVPYWTVLIVGAGVGWSSSVWVANLPLKL